MLKDAHARKMLARKGSIHEFRRLYPARLSAGDVRSDASYPSPSLLLSVAVLLVATVALAAPYRVVVMCPSSFVPSSRRTDSSPSVIVRSIVLQASSVAKEGAFVCWELDLLGINRCVANPLPDRHDRTDATGPSSVGPAGSKSRGRSADDGSKSLDLDSPSGVRRLGSSNREEQCLAEGAGPEHLDLLFSPRRLSLA